MGILFIPFCASMGETSGSWLTINGSRFKVTSGSLLMVKGYGLWKKGSITRNGAVREKQP